MTGCGVCGWAGRPRWTAMAISLRKSDEYYATFHLWQKPDRVQLSYIAMANQANAVSEMLRERKTFHVVRIRSKWRFENVCIARTHSHTHTHRLLFSSFDFVTSFFHIIYTLHKWIPLHHTSHCEIWFFPFVSFAHGGMSGSRSVLRRFAR